MRKEQQSGAFTAFVLLSGAGWEPERLMEDMYSDWGIVCQTEYDGEAAYDGRKQPTLNFAVDGMAVDVGLAPMPLPDVEAGKTAVNHWMWEDAGEVAKRHQAHIAVSVSAQGRPHVKLATLLTQVTASCLKQEKALGVYTCHTIIAPDFYRKAALDIKNGILPVLDWVYLGLYRGLQGTCAYTCGMGMFGKDEIEVLESAQPPSELYGLLFNLVTYVLQEDAVLHHGETISFSAEQRLFISRTPGVAVDGMSLKIGF